MTKRRIIWWAIMPLIGTCAAAQVSEWATSGDWRVSVGAETGNGCYIEKDFDSGIRFVLGFLPDRDGGFIAALNTEWTHLTPGDKAVVKFFTSEEKFAGEVEMIERDGLHGGWAFFNNPAFVSEIAKRRSLRIVGPEGGEFELDLTGSALAIAEMKRCQAAQ